MVFFSFPDVWVKLSRDIYQTIHNYKERDDYLSDTKFTKGLP